MGILRRCAVGAGLTNRPVGLFYADFRDLKTEYFVRGSPPEESRFVPVVSQVTEGSQLHDLKCSDPVSQSVLVGGVYIRLITW